jgi:hypothetical protein
MSVASPAFDSVSDIQMAVQIAEHNLHHYPGTEQINITLSLITIARGSCTMLVRPDAGVGSAATGQIHIPADRAVMSAYVSLGRDDFQNLVGYLRHPAPRPITVVVKLDQNLAVDEKGVLFIDGPIDATITDLFWSFPLR